MRYSELTISDTGTWAELCDSFVPMTQRYSDPDHWSARMTVQETTAYQLLRWDQQGNRFGERTSSLVRKYPGDDFYWAFFPEEQMVAIRKNEELNEVGPSRAMLLDLSQTLQVYVPTSKVYALKVPREEIDHRIRDCGHQRIVFDMSRGLGRIVQGMIRSVHAEQSALSDREFNAVSDRISELLCMMAMGDMSPQQAHLAETAEAIRRYVRENIGTGDIRLAAVSEALGWSTRQLRLVLQQAGTTYRDLRQEETLRAAHDMLEQQGPHALTIGQVAARCGFTKTWFSAAFKARYGETPRDFRKRRLDELTTTGARNAPRR
ncbi:helix-turn-helix domain-containing protein [Nocardia sp. Marseille-Q1738]